MKTQINTLVSGLKNQFLNVNKDYSIFLESSSHCNHSGSNNKEVRAVWQEVIKENENGITILILGREIKLKANWSKSKESCFYAACMSSYIVEEIGLVPTKNETASITIMDANCIRIRNGGNSFKYICPSLITIL